jgi:hypothetical protein
MLRKFTSKRWIAVLTVVGALAAAGGAFAYFSASGTGTGQAAVGGSTDFAVSFGTTTGTMYPGAGTSTVHYTITNNGGGYQNLSGTTAALAKSGDDITSGGNDVAGCLASWFTVTNHSTSGDLAAHGTASSTVDLTLTDSGGNQDPCKGASPDVVINAS